jgi:hypothetical protein
VYDEEGNLLDEKPIDPIEVEKRKKIAMVRNKIEDLIQRAKSSNEAMDCLVSSVQNIDSSLGNIVPTRCHLDKKNMKILLVAKFQNKYKYIRQMMFDQKGGVKRIKRAKELPKPRKGKNAKNLMKEPPQ